MQTYIKELSARLVELNKGGPISQEITQEVEKLTKEVSFLLMRLSVVRPIETRKFIAVSRQYLNTEAEAIDMWKNVVVSSCFVVPVWLTYGACTRSSIIRRHTLACCYPLCYSCMGFTGIVHSGSLHQERLHVSCQYEVTQCSSADVQKAAAC